MSVTHTHMSRHTQNKQKHCSGTQINSVLLRTWRTAHTAAYINAVVQPWQVWLQHQLSYVNSLVGVVCGTLIEPGPQITLYHSASLPQIAI